jgi:hypothetical protein
MTAIIGPLLHHYPGHDPQYGAIKLTQVAQVDTLVVGYDGLKLTGITDFEPIIGSGLQAKGYTCQQQYRHWKNAKHWLIFR